MVNQLLKIKVGLFKWLKQKTKKKAGRSQEPFNLYLCLNSGKIQYTALKIIEFIK